MNKTQGITEMLTKSKNMIFNSAYASQGGHTDKDYLTPVEELSPSEKASNGPPKLKALVLNSTKKWFDNSTFHGK